MDSDDDDDADLVAKAKRQTKGSCLFFFLFAETHIIERLGFREVAVRRIATTSNYDCFLFFFSHISFLPHAHTQTVFALSSPN